MKNKKLIKATLAAAALAFATIPVTSALAHSHKGHVKCFGANACKGKSSCKTAHNACKGKNSCKGTGMIMKKSEAKCLKAGGKVLGS